MFSSGCLLRLKKAQHLGHAHKPNRVFVFAFVPRFVFLFLLLSSFRKVSVPQKIEGK